MGRFENLKFAPGLKTDGVLGPEIWRGHFGNCIRPFEKHQKWVQMIHNTICDIFQPINYLSYGLDVEIRPKLTPGAGTQVQYRTALWLHGHDDHPRFHIPNRAHGALSRQLLHVSGCHPVTEHNLTTCRTYSRKTIACQAAPNSK